MYARTHSASLLGVEAFLVRVEAHCGRGTASYRTVGLPTKTVRESERRIRSAIARCGGEIPVGTVTVNLAPADLPKDGAALDLAIAVALLLCSSSTRQEAARGRMFLGELALDGSLRPVRGTLAAAHRARREGLARVVVPVENVQEARAVEGLEVWGAATLAEVLAQLRGEAPPRRPPSTRIPAGPAPPDLRDVRGQDTARRALEIAAAGGHNILLQGPPGTGKSMLAARLPGILPKLHREEAIEATKVHSAAGLLPPGAGLLSHPPFRSPHHTVSYAGLLGGGSVPRPGEVSLAHCGVLYLDEMPEFSRPCLEGLRQPLESGTIDIVRGVARARFPARITLVGSMNSCPCGYRGGGSKKDCTCTLGQIRRYMHKLSGPLLDRFDLVVEVPAVPLDRLLEKGEAEPSATVRQRVLSARRFCRERHPHLACNARLDAAALQEAVPVDPESRSILDLAIKQQHLSARGVHRVLRVGRTIADLAASGPVEAAHIVEALQYRRPELSDLH